MTYDESWQTDSGRFSDYIGTVHDEYFAASEKYPDQWSILLVMKTDSPDRPEYVERYKLGKGWSSEDGGENVVSNIGAKKFHQLYSSYAQFIDTAVPLLTAAGAAEEVQARGPATYAPVWHGTRWQMTEKRDQYQPWDAVAKKPQVDEHGNAVYRTTYLNLPTAFLGMEGASGVANGHASVTNVDLTFIPEELFAVLADAAHKAATREAWLDRIMLDVPAVMEDGLSRKLAGQGVYAALKAS